MVLLTSLVTSTLRRQSCTSLSCRCASRFLALALAVNELATNAMKYGALQNAGGKVDITWSIDAEKAMQWTWQESGGPTVVAPERTGFGSRVIKELLADELKGTSDIAFASTGLVCRLSVPSENLLTST